MVARFRVLPILLPLSLLSHGGPAAAQDVHSPSVSIELASDLRLRGLSWSDGRPSLGAWADVPLSSATSMKASLYTANGAARSGGGDVALAMGLRQRLSDGPVRIDAGGGCRAFPGGASAFCEVEADAAYDIAWITLGAGIAYAPRQHAIGGDNLYTHMRARAAVPGQPWAVDVHVGRSAGAVTDPVRADRLRPDGARYRDHGIGLSYGRGRLGGGIRYVGATGTGHARDADDTLVAHIALLF
ncbi:MAG: TorF family putative porin [Sphingobium sp.]